MTTLTTAQMTAAKETFKSLPSEIKTWWTKLDNSVKSPKDFQSWMSLSADQWIAIYEIVLGRYKSITLTGCAGSGKTFTSKFAQKVLESTGKEVLMVASTGIAAYLSGGVTINSAFSMGADSDILPSGVFDKIHHSVKPQRNVKGKTEFQVQMRKSIESVVRKVQANGLINKDAKSELVIFFDEIGMFSSENLTIAIQIVRQLFLFTKRPVRFVFLADYRQLLPVHKPSETPWKISSNLAIHKAEFETLCYVNTPEGVEYQKIKYSLPSQLGVIKTPDGITMDGAITLSLITNHRQGENKLFIDNLNSIGDGTGCFTRNANYYASSIAKRIYLTEDNETYNWVASQDRKNEVIDATLLETGIHVFFSNRSVSERNTVGTTQAVDALKTKFKGNYINHVRDYTVNIIVAKGETADSITRVIQDISPVGITTLSTKDSSYQHEKATHASVASFVSKDLHTFAYQRVCVGMRWMCRMNLNAKLRNGTVCTVTYVNDKYFNVVVDNDIDKEHIRIEAETELFVKKNGKGIPIAKVYGVPGHPAYALTFHKTQGITVPRGTNFILHITSEIIAFAMKGGVHGLLYVGLSRVETLEQLYIMYEANIPVERGMNELCKTNASVFEFIKYTETCMRQYLDGTYVHTYNLVPVVAAPITKDKEPDLFSAVPEGITTSRRMGLKHTSNVIETVVTPVVEETVIEVPEVEEKTVIEVPTNRRMGGGLKDLTARPATKEEELLQ